MQKFQGDITREHVQNFLDCCRSRKLPNADVYIVHRSSQACLLGNESYLDKRRIRFDPAREAVLPHSAETKHQRARESLIQTA